MSLASNIGNIAHASDLVTVLRGIKYYNVHYFFTNSDLDRVETYRNNTGFKFYAPPSTDVLHFLYWQVDKERISGDQELSYGLSSSISAFLHNVDMNKVVITPNIPSTLINVEDLRELSIGGRIVGKTIYDANATKSLDLSTFRCTWLSDYAVQYSNTYPSVMLNLSCLHDGYRFDHWKVSSDVNPYLFANDEFAICSVFEVNSDALVYPNYVKLVYVASKVNGLGQIAGLRSSYDKNELIGLSAIPSAHYHFSHWDGSLVDAKNKDLSIVYAVMSAESNTLTAHFDRNTYTLFALTIGNDGEQLNCNVIVTDPTDMFYKKFGKKLSIDFYYGKQIQLSALNSSSLKYKFTNWSDGVLTNSRKITMNESMHLSAIYAKSGVLKLNIIICPEGAGYVRLTNSNSLYYSGDSTILYAFETNPEYRFGYWSNGVSSTHQIMHNLQQTTNLSAVFVDKMQIRTGTGDVLGAYVDGVLEDIVYQK